MVRRSNFGTGPGDGVEVNGVFITINKAHTSILIDTGDEEPHPIMESQMIPKHHWVPLNIVIDQDFDDARDLTRGDKVSIFLPQWFLEKNGMV